MTKTNKNELGRVLSHLFDYDLNQSSPVVDDVIRKVNYDEDGNEIVTFEKVDYAKLQASNGLVGDWSLDALLKAGIDPAFPIHTGNNTRLEGVDVIARAEQIADSLFADATEPANEENK